MTVCGEKVTGVCAMGKCPHFKRCCPVVWDKYGKIKPKTNFEWLTKTPERLASWIEYILIESGCEVTQCRETWIMWLKQPHTEKE